MTDRVEHEHCAACGFDGSSYDDDSLVAALRALGPRWRKLIDGSGNDLRVRPRENVWSAIEYAAHSRDVTALHAFGVEQALTTDEPRFPEIDGDSLIESAAVSYGDADPGEVVNVLDAEASRLADMAAGAGHDSWSRGVTVGDSRLDVRRLLEHALHDSVHHLDDVERGLAEIRSRRN